MLDSNSSTDRRILYNSFTAGGQIGPTKDISDYNSVVVFCQGTYGSSLTLMFEVSMDGAAWTSIQGVRTDTTAVGTGVTLTASQIVGYDVFVGAYNYFRIRSSTWPSPSGQCDVWCVASTASADPSISATIAGLVQVQGSQIHSSALGNNPLAVCGQAKSAVDTTLVDGDACNLTMTTARQVITKDFGSAENDLQFSAAGITTTTSAANIAAAAGTSSRNYVTAIQAINTSATATKLQILDGASIIWQIQLPASMAAPMNVVFPTPLKCSQNTMLNYNFSVAGATVDLNVQGFKNF